MRRPTSQSLIKWASTTTEKLADSVENLNEILEDRENDPQWTNKAWANTRHLFNWRHWASAQPDGGGDKIGPARKIKIRHQIKVEEVEDEGPSVTID